MIIDFGFLFVLLFDIVVLRKIQLANLVRNPSKKGNAIINYSTNIGALIVTPLVGSVIQKFCCGGSYGKFIL